ncbi:MAG TPA: hypothetical protein VF348_08640, partial [Usitatibacter sp.]
MNKTMRRHVACLSTLLAAGCAAVPPAPVMPETPKEAGERRAKAAAPTYNLTGYPPAVRDGYIDGCESAKNTAYARKDTQRMAGDPQYS